MLNYRARCLAAQTGETKHNRYFVGSHNLQEKNQVPLRLLDLLLTHRFTTSKSLRTWKWRVLLCILINTKSGRSLEARTIRIYSSRRTIQVRWISYLKCVCWLLGTAFKGSLWKINEQTGKIEHLEKLGQATGSIKRYLFSDWNSVLICSVLWDPSESDDAHNIAYLDDNSVHIWDLNTAQVCEGFFLSLSVNHSGIESPSNQGQPWQNDVWLLESLLPRQCYPDYGR